MVVMALRLVSRLSSRQSSSLIRRCYFGTSCIRTIEKDDISSPQNEVHQKQHTGSTATSNKDPDSLSMEQMILESATSNNDKNGDSDYDDYYYDSEDELKTQILKTALEYVPEHGWTHESLKKACEAEGLSTAVEDLFPRGPGDLVLYFIENCNSMLAEQLLHESEQQADIENRDPHPKVSTHTFIQDAIITRLQMLRPYIQTWPQAVQLLIRPNTAPAAMESLANMVDEIWYHAGDTSTDLNWYTKRGSLAAIYGASELFMMQDRSEDYQCTWKFVEQRLENANQLKNLSDTVQGFAVNASSFLSSIISTSQNMAGNNCRKR